MINENAGQPVKRIGPKTDIDLTNAEKIFFACLNRKLTISVAESMTAGGFCYALTRVPGSSRVFCGGLVTYTRETKQSLLGLSDEICDKGLVTPEITLEMARLVRKKFNTSYGIAVTGNAGPTADTGGASIGRVYWAVADWNGVERISEHDFFGNRDEVRAKAVTAGLRVFRNFLETVSEIA